MCTTSLCNDNDYNVLSERPNQFLRKQLGPQRLPFNSVAQGEIENNYTNTTGNNESTPGQSNKHNSTSILVLQPFSHKQNITLPSHPALPLSIINTQNNTSIETLYVDTTVKDLETQNVMLNHNELPETPREEALLDKFEEEEEQIFEDFLFEDSDQDEIEPNSTVSKHRVPRQAQGEN